MVHPTSQYKVLPHILHFADNAPDIPTNTHSWKNTTQANPGFMCAREVDGMFKVHLGGSRGVRARGYQFRIASLTRTDGTYSSLMLAACKHMGMKPVWYVCVW